MQPAPDSSSKRLPATASPSPMATNTIAVATVNSSNKTDANADKRKSKRLRSPIRDPDLGAGDTAPKKFKRHPDESLSPFVSSPVGTTTTTGTHGNTSTSNASAEKAKSSNSPKLNANPSDEDLVSTNPNAPLPTRKVSSSANATPANAHNGKPKHKAEPMTGVAGTTSTSADAATKIHPASSSLPPPSGAVTTVNSNNNTNLHPSPSKPTNANSDTVSPGPTIPASPVGSATAAEVISDITPSSTGSNSVATAAATVASKKKAGKGKAKKSKDEKWLRISDICDQENIMWTKVKGHPYWPTQLVRLDQNLVQEERFQTAAKFRRKGDDKCVMYFGTCEVAWINVKKIAISWKEGIKKDLHNVLKARPTYQTALKEVLGYCAKATIYPRSWWCEPKCFSLAHEFLDIVRAPLVEEKLETFSKDAEHDRICWARMRGYPFWPVQVLPLDVVSEHYPELRFRKPADGRNPKSWPCMFFGTGEVAMIGDKQIRPFITGVRLRFWMNSDRNDFIVSMGEMWGYLQKPRIWPSGYISSRTWWNSPPKEVATVFANAAEDQPNFPKFEIVERSVHPSSTASATLGRSKKKMEAEDSTCKCKGNGCGDDSCYNVASRFWCDPDNCTENCKNKPFWLRKQKKITPFYTADSRGWGLRLDEKVRAGEFITEYVGELIDKDELAKRLNKKNAKGETNYYIMDTNDEWFLDAEFKGNNSRFINSSCEPNCESQKWVEQKTGITHVGIFAIKDILPGTEITYNYRQNFGFGFQIDGGEVNRKFVCRCRSDTCCMMDPTERDWVLKAVGRRIKVKWDDGWYTGKVESYDQDRKKFTILYDDGDDEELTLGLPTVPKNGDGVQFKWMTKGEDG